MTHVRCFMCQYELAGLGENPRCPECGFEHGPFTVRARLQGDSGDTLKVILLTIMLEGLVIGVVFQLFRLSMGLTLHLIGKPAVVVMPALFFGAVIAIFMYVPRIVRRVAYKDGPWNCVLTVTDIGLEKRRLSVNAERRFNSWDYYTRARLKCVKEGVWRLSLIMKGVPLMFAEVYLIDADETRARQFMKAVSAMIARRRGESAEKPSV